MIIRKAKKDDWADIRKLIARYPKQLSQAHVPPVKDFFVALEDEEMVGCCALAIYSQRIAEVRSLAVLKKWQGHGIGKKLVEICLKKAKKKGIYEVFAITGKEKLFNSFGFKPFHQEKIALFKVLKP